MYRSRAYVALGIVLFVLSLVAEAQPAGNNTVQQAEVKMLRSSVERLSKENAELKKQVAELKKKLEEKPGAATPIKWVVVCDSGESMSARLDVAKKQAKSVIGALPDSQAFNVVMATPEHPRAFRGVPVAAKSENRSAAQQMIEPIVARGKTKLLPAIQFALDQRPDVVHLITDATCEVKPAELAEAVAKLNAEAKAKIHTTIACCASDQVDQMKALWRIARDSGGNCTDDRGNVVVEEPRGSGALFK